MYEDATTIATDARCNGSVEHPVRLQPKAELHNGATLGAFGFLNVGSIVYGGVTIGRYFSSGRGAEIGVVGHPVDGLSTHGFVINSAWFPTVQGYGKHINARSPDLARKTTIGHDVWIGAQAIILAGVSIGSGAVIGANSVVTSDVMPYEIVAGTPARHVRYRFSDKVRDKLIESRWWELPFDQISTLPYHDVEATLSLLANLRSPLGNTIA